MGLKRFLLSTPCRNGHLDERLVCNNICLACARQNNKIHYKRALKDQRNTEDGRERRVANDRRYLESNKELINARRRARYHANNDAKLKTHREWVSSNKPSVLASQRKIRFLRMKRAPKWLNDDDWISMEAFYAKAKEIKKSTGIKQHVDHIVPLVGKNVSGLHVPWNLRVLPAADNLAKSNKFTDPPDERSSTLIKFDQ